LDVLLSCSKQYVKSTENETNNDMAVTQYNPEKLFEKMENNFVQALEKVRFALWLNKKNPVFRKNVTL
jgi:hypothetical protein